MLYLSFGVQGVFLGTIEYFLQSPHHLVKVNELWLHGGIQGDVGVSR